MPILQSNKETGTLYINNVFDMAKDVVVTLDYYANVGATGGILFGVIPHWRVAPDGKSTGQGMGYATVSSADCTTGILDTSVGVALDFGGTFASTLVGVNGLTAIETNAVTVRGRASDSYPLLATSGNLSAQNFYLADGTQKRVRFRVADLGDKVFVDVKNINDRVFTNYLEYRLEKPVDLYSRVYVAFNVDVTTTIHVQSLNYNAHDVTMLYCLSADEQIGYWTPSCPELSQGQTISAVNVSLTPTTSALGTLISIANASAGAPYVGSEYVSIVYTLSCACDL